MRRDFTPEDLYRILSRNKYEGAIAAAMLDDPEETDWLLSLARSQRAPWIAGVIGAAVCSRRLADSRLLAVRIHPSPTAPASIAAAAGAGKTIDLRLAPGEIAAGLALLRAAPDARFILVPRAGPLWDPEPWRDMAAFPNAAVKICGLINDAGPAGWRAATYTPFVRRLLAWFGANRFLYGSDWPHCMRAGTWKESLAAFTQALGPQTMEVRSMILGENAARWYLGGTLPADG